MALTLGIHVWAGGQDPRRGVVDLAPQAALSLLRHAMSKRFWPIKESILPVLPRRAVAPVAAGLDAGTSSTARAPEVPFFRLAAHREPTLWSLYRPLLRGWRAVSSRDVFAKEGDGELVCEAVRQRWHRARTLTSPKTTRDFLEREYGVSRAKSNSSHQAC